MIEKFWKVAISVAGLGGIGAFVFWSLYKQWLTLPIFSKLSQSQTFGVMIVFLMLTFFTLIAILVTYLKAPITKNQETSDNPIRRPANITLVDLIVKQKDIPCIEFKIRNNSDEVVFLKTAEIQVKKQWDIFSPEMPRAIPVTESYDIELSNTIGSTVRCNLSQEIKPASVDRFEFTFGSSHAPYPYIGLFLYLLNIKLIYNENNTELEIPKVLMHIQTKMEIQGSFNPGPSPELISKNKQITQEVLLSIDRNTIYDEDLLNAIKSWADE